MSDALISFGLQEQNLASEENPGQQPNQVIKPPICKTQVPKLVKAIYGFNVIETKQMNGYDDQNFHIKVEEGQNNNPHVDTINPNGYTLKIINWLDSAIPGFLEAIHEAQIHIHSKGMAVPIPIRNVKGTRLLRVPETTFADGQIDLGPEIGNANLYAVQLLTYVPGVTFSSIPYTKNVLFQFGQLLAKLNHAYEDFSNPVLEKRSFLWSLFGLPKVTPFLFAVQDADRRQLAEETIKDFTLSVLPIAKKMPKVFIHGDFNENNVLVRSLNSSEYGVYGVLDFTDNHLAPKIFEVAVALTYTMLECETMDPLLAAGHALAGYLSLQTLDEVEMSLLKICIEARFSQSLVMGAYTFHQDPGNHYALSSARQGWTLLKRMRETPNGELESKWSEVVKSYSKA